MKNPVIIIGANAIGRLVKEIFEKNEVVVYGFLEDLKKNSKAELDDIAILGSPDDENFLKLIGKKCEVFIASDENQIKKSFVKVLNEENKVQPINAVHPSASLSSKSSIGHGNLIDQQVILAPGCHFGNHNILHAGAIFGVDVSIGDYVQVGTRSSINHGVSIEDEVFIGSGTVVVAGVKIGKGARVGAGSVVIESVKAGETVFGNPAQKMIA